METKTEKRTALQLFNAIRDARLVRGAELILLMMLSTRANPHEDFTCFPSLELLGKDTGLSKSAIQRAARALEKKGLIARVVRSNRSTRYEIQYDAIVTRAIRCKEESREGVYGAVFNEETDEIRSEYKTAWEIGGAILKARFGKDCGRLSNDDCVGAVLDLHRRLASLSELDAEGLAAWIKTPASTMTVAKLTARCTTPVAALQAFSKHFDVVVESFMTSTAEVSL